jgi:dienelactone hydrolase
VSLITAVIDAGVRTIVVREDGLVGTLFLPASRPPYPVVIALGGSGGGIFAMPALPLASHGIAVLAMAYFGMERLPAELKRIPLEYFGSAIEWLRGRDELRPGVIGVVGGSRGGELALLVAATYPDIKAVVGWAPSGVMYGGLSRGAAGPVAAWCRGGRDLPFAGFDGSAVDWNRRPIRFTPGFVAALSDTTTVSAAEIPVERINGPVLLISGSDDQVWPSSLLSEVAVRRFRERGHRFPVEHVCYEGAGHAIVPPHPFASFGPTHFIHPVTGYDFELGGTPELNAKASVDSWQRILRFLDQRFLSV